MATKDYYATLAGCLKWDLPWAIYSGRTRYNGYNIMGPRTPVVYKNHLYEDSHIFPTIEKALEYIDAQSS